MCAPGFEISGQNTKKMALECGGTHSKIYKLAQMMMHFWPRRPGARLNFGLTCPIFRSRTAGIASRSAPGLRTSVRPVRIAVVRLGSRHEVFDIGALSIINFDPLLVQVLDTGPLRRPWPWPGRLDEPGRRPDPWSTLKGYFV